MLIGCLLQDASLTYPTKYPLCTDDFCIDYQKVVFATIKNLNKRGNKTVDYIDIDQYLSKYEVQHEIFKDCGGTNNPQNFIDTAFDLGVVDNYEYYYNELRN